MLRVRLLSKDEIKRKCHIGEGARCCVFLIVGADGLECGYVEPEMRINLEAERGHFTAKSGPCADPYDTVSEAAPYEPPRGAGTT